MSSERLTSLGDTGLEGPSRQKQGNDSENNDLPQNDNAVDSAKRCTSAADTAGPVVSDPDLAMVVKVWPILPEAVKVRIMATIRGASQ